MESQAHSVESVNNSQGLFKCADRKSPGDEPRDITSIKSLYVPFDTQHSATHIRRNPFGVVIYQNKVEPGKVYQAFDGRRLVVELGCDTVIYVHINPQMPQRHHRLFIQSESAFSGDTTIRRDAAEIAKNTRHVETIVKYEMYFIMGVLSTASVAAWLAVTGSDVTVMVANKKATAGAAKELARTLLAELEEIKSYAPIVHEKVWELVLAESEVIAVKAGKALPSTIVNDEKTQAQVAGVLFGKWALPKGNPFNVWTVLSVLLTQAASKSVTQYPEAVMSAITSRYKSLLEDLRQVELSRPMSFQKPATSLVTLLSENGVTVTQAEASQMLKEIVTHRDRAHKSFTVILNAVQTFRRKVNK